MERCKKSNSSAAAEAEALRVQGLREDARRSLRTTAPQQHQARRCSAPRSRSRRRWPMGNRWRAELRRPTITSRQGRDSRIAGVGLCSREDLKAMKQAAGRTCDLADSNTGASSRSAYDQGRRVRVNDAWQVRLTYSAGAKRWQLAPIDYGANIRLEGEARSPTSAAGDTHHLDFIRRAAKRKCA